MFQAEDGIRDLVRSRGLGDVYKRQLLYMATRKGVPGLIQEQNSYPGITNKLLASRVKNCLLYTSDAADERSSVDLGGRRIIKKKKSDKSYDC